MQCVCTLTACMRAELDPMGGYQLPLPMHWWQLGIAWVTISTVPISRHHEYTCTHSPTVGKYPLGGKKNAVAKLDLCRERLLLRTHYKVVLELVEGYGASGPEPFQRCLRLENCYMHRCDSYRWVLNMSSHGNAVKCTQWQYMYVSNQKQAVQNYIYVPKYMLCCLTVCPASQIRLSSLQ